jgi:hypothetical protein
MPFKLQTKTYINFLIQGNKDAAATTWDAMEASLASEFYAFNRTKVVITPKVFVYLNFLTDTLGSTRGISPANVSVIADHLRHFTKQRVAATPRFPALSKKWRHQKVLKHMVTVMETWLSSTTVFATSLDTATMKWLRGTQKRAPKGWPKNSGGNKFRAHRVRAPAPLTRPLVPPDGFIAVAAAAPSAAVEEFAGFSESPIPPQKPDLKTRPGRRSSSSSSSSGHRRKQPPEEFAGFSESPVPPRMPDLTPRQVHQVRSRKRPRATQPAPSAPEEFAGFTEFCD